MGKKNVCELVRKWAEEPCARAGVFIWDVEYVREGAESYLRLLIDSDDGVTLDQCELVTREVNEKLDEADPIEAQYTFEVGSPGIERALKETWQYERYVGEKIRIKLYKAIDGKKELIGTLEAATPESVRLDGVDYDRKDVAKASVYAEF